MSQHEFDLVVIGTGPAASTVAKKAAEDDHRVAVIEERELGGTCALRGCNPKKVYVNAGALVASCRHAHGKLIDGPLPGIDWKQLLKFKNEFTESVPEKAADSLERRGIKVFQGTASFCGRQSIAVGDDNIEAKRVFVGTGASPRELKIPGNKFLVTSDQLMERESIPGEVVFVGGGYVSMEFAHVIAQFGSRVTVLESRDRVLSAFDPDLTDQLTEWSERNGVTIHTSAMVESIEQHGEKFVVHFQQDATKTEVECDLVVHGAGRTPNLAALNLPNANVDASEDGIVVDGFLRSPSNPVVFAAGDCADTGKPKLTPTANEEARAVVNNLFLDPESEKQISPHYGVIPAVAFTTPCIASVGLSEQEAKSHSEFDLEIRHEDISKWNNVRKTCLACAGYKVLVDRRTDRIVGAHLLGPGAEESINLFTLAMKFNLTASDVKSTLFAFPTQASDVRNMVK